MGNLQLRYDGKYEYQMVDARSWTVTNHFIFNGRDLYKASFTGAQAIQYLLRGKVL
jgi:hypothetical protein